MKKYEDAIKILEEYDDLCDFVGEFDDEVIFEAEKKLGVHFPKTYARYLKEYGAGNFGSQEIYGIVDDELKAIGIPNAIWLTQNEREENQLPKELVIIYYSGDEFYYCLDTSKMENDECPIVSLEIGDLNGEKEIVYDDFGEFFLDILNQEL